MVARVWAMRLLALVAFGCASGHPVAVDQPAPGEVVVLPAPSASPSPAREAIAVAPPPPTPVPIELFVMSQCPYGTPVETTMSQVVQKLGAVDLKIDFVGTADATGALSTMHGEKELMGDLVQVCAMKHTPRWLDLVVCQNRDIKEVDSNWQACGEELGIRTEAIAACAGGSEGKDLLAASFERSVARGARASPTMFIGGTRYEGPRTVAGFAAAACRAYGPEGRAPAACAAIVQAPPVRVTELVDGRCSDCRASRFSSVIGLKLVNPALTTVDYQSAEGKALFAALKPLRLPAFVFDESLDRDADALAALEKGLRKVGDKRVMAGTEWNPVCADAGGCKLSECQHDLACRSERPKKLELYTMSKCPYCAKGLFALQEVLENAKKSGSTIELGVAFIGRSDPKAGLTSMHGPREVEEDLRQICVAKLYRTRNKFFDYLLCRASDQKSDDWEACTGGKTGFDAKAIRKCAEGTEGKALLEDSFAYSTASGIAAAPTWVVNNKLRVRAANAEALKKALCDKNAKLGGCQNTLTAKP